MLVLFLAACNGGEEPADDQPFTFNYIPDYETACFPEEEQLDDVVAINRSTVQSDTFVAVPQIEVCGPDSCIPCSDDPAQDNYNPMYDALTDFDDWGSELAKGYLDLEGVASDELLDVFEAALAYPWRHLLLHGVPGDGTTLRLSPGLATSCLLEQESGGPECLDEHYRLDAAGLDESCSEYRNTLTADFSVEDDHTVIHTQVGGLEPFGFQVPLVAELPPPDSFEGVPQLMSYIDEQETLTVRIENPSLTADGTCARMDGHVAPSVFASLIGDPADMQPYMDASGRIPTTLVLHLEPAVVGPAE